MILDLLVRLACVIEGIGTETKANLLHNKTLSETNALEQQANKNTHQGTLFGK